MEGMDKSMDLDEFLDLMMKKERVIKFPLSMYYSEGTKYLNLLQHTKALEFLNEAVQNDPTHMKSLLKRSKCFIALRDYPKAIEDADSVLSLYPDCVEAIDLKGRAQYMMGDFEGGYLTYREGKQKKPVNDVFRLGQQLCEEAMDKTMLSPELKLTKCDVAGVEDTRQDDEKFAKRLRLKRGKQDCLGADRKFMEDLLADKYLRSVHDHCKEGITYIKDCERFWAQETPLHLRRVKSKVVKREAKKPQHPTEKQMKICIAAKRRAEKELEKGRVDDCIREVGKMLNVIQYLPKKESREKTKFECDALHLLALAYKLGGNSSLCFRNIVKELEVAIEHNLVLPQTVAFHQLGEFYHGKRSLTRTLQCLNRVLAAVTSTETLEKLLDECTSVEDVKRLQDAHTWANEVICSIRMSLRDTIITPVMDTVVEYSKNLSQQSLAADSEKEMASEL